MKLTAGTVSAIYPLGGTLLFRQVGHVHSAVYKYLNKLHYYNCFGTSRDRDDYELSGFERITPSPYPGFDRVDIFDDEMEPYENCEACIKPIKL